MEKRVLIAVLLMTAVIMGTNLLFPPAEQPAADSARGDSAAVVAAPTPAPAPAPAVRAPALPATAPQAPAQPVTVRSPLYRYTFSTRGASLTSAEMLRHGSALREGEPVDLVPQGAPDFLTYRVAMGGDTLDLRGLPFQASATRVELAEGGEAQQLRFTYGGGEGLGVEVVYTFRPDDYLVDVAGRVTGAGSGAVLLTGLGSGLATHEADPERFQGDLGAIALTPDGVENVPFQKVEGSRTLQGPLTWAAVKDKYFLAALVAGDRPAFGGMTLRRLPSARVVAGSGADADTTRIPRAQTVVSLPLGADGAFAFGAYLGPQEHGRLAAVGYNLDDVNPYGYRWLRPVVRPIAASALWVMRELHDNLGVGYGWVLIIFGVMVKILLWPLNAKAMRAQMKNMAVQPLIQELQTKYKGDPQKQQEEMIRLYKEHGFNPLAGCLPLLIPMPIFITLYFVFQSAIEFRGVPFWYLPDLSQRDPYYLMPLLFIGSTFLLQWISTKLSGMEANPQMKMMMYLMPIMMGAFFITLAAGLNLYYTASNLAGLPQQVLIARERKRATEEAKAKRAAEEAAAKRASGGPPPAARQKRRR
ncbi:MAG TPA: membrane protein insertase YidC [Longimicrobiaceae bacterium]|nr:membrane protein insertase YidC [Longimicrobiaceae bacterium]